MFTFTAYGSLKGLSPNTHLPSGPSTSLKIQVRTEAALEDPFSFGSTRAERSVVVGHSPATASDCTTASAPASASQTSDGRLTATRIGCRGDITADPAWNVSPRKTEHSTIVQRSFRHVR